MNKGTSARPIYICDKCGYEINYIYRKGFAVHKYAKWSNSCYVKDFDLCTNCEKKFREWLKEKEIPTTKEMISRFPVYRES